MTTIEALNELNKMAIEEERLQQDLEQVTGEISVEIEDLQKQLQDAMVKRETMGSQLRSIIRELRKSIDALSGTIPDAWDSEDKTIKIGDVAYTRRTSEVVSIPDENELKGYCRSFENQPFTTNIKWDKRALKQMAEMKMIPKDMIEIQQKHTLVKKKIV